LSWLAEGQIIIACEVKCIVAVDSETLVADYCEVKSIVFGDWLYKLTLKERYLDTGTFRRGDVNYSLEALAYFDRGMGVNLEAYKKLLQSTKRVSEFLDSEHPLFTKPDFSMI